MAATDGGLHADLVHMAHDDGLCAKIMKKRQEEMARRTKLLDPRTRQFGIGHRILDDQVAQKRATQEQAAAEEAYFAQSNILQEQVLQACEDMKASQVRERDRNAIEFSLTNLRKEQRREYHLSDPHVLRNERPVDPTDPNLGPCSMQKWDGECMDMHKKKKEDATRMRDWLNTQKQEKRDRLGAERALDRRFDQEVLLANEVRAVCEQAARDEARQDKLEETAENLRLAEENMARRHARQMKEIANKERHVDNIVNGERMKETMDYQLGSHGRILKTEYKRMTVDEEMDVYNSNARQVAEKQARYRQEGMEEMDHTNAVHLGISVMGGIEQEKNRQAKERQRKMVEANQLMADEKRKSDMDERRLYRTFDHPAPGY